MNAVTPIRADGPSIAEAFKPIAASVSRDLQWAGFPCLGTIELHAEYIQRDAVRAQEAFFSSNGERFAKHRDEILARFEKLEAEIADFRSRVGMDPEPQPPAANAMAVAERVAA